MSRQRASRDSTQLGPVALDELPWREHDHALSAACREVSDVSRDQGAGHRDRHREERLIVGVGKSGRQRWWSMSNAGVSTPASVASTIHPRSRGREQTSYKDIRVEDDPHPARRRARALRVLAMTASISRADIAAEPRFWLASRSARSASSARARRRVSSVWSIVPASTGIITATGRPFAVSTASRTRFKASRVCLGRVRKSRMVPDFMYTLIHLRLMVVTQPRCPRGRPPRPARRRLPASSCTCARSRAPMRRSGLPEDQPHRQTELVGRALKSAVRRNGEPTGRGRCIHPFTPPRHLGRGVAVPVVARRIVEPWPYSPAPRPNLGRAYCTPGEFCE